jgi:hypothetical protein
MQYTIEVPEVMGDVFFLYRVAEAMAKRTASAGDRGFHQAVYKQMLRRYIEDLVSEAQEGRLKVCNQTGAIRTPDKILADARGKHGLVSSLKDTSETVALNVCVSLRQLNIWAHERGNDFQITHEGVPWVDERGWINGEVELTIDVRPSADEHLSAPTETRLPQADELANSVVQSQAGTLGALFETDAAKVEMATSKPPPLTTGDIAFCFAGLNWKTEESWKKMLGNQRKWTEACVAAPAGGRGRGQASKLWNPVFLGAAMVTRGYVTQNRVRAKFQCSPQLMPWLDAWKTYEADYLDGT